MSSAAPTRRRGDSSRQPVRLRRRSPQALAARLLTLAAELRRTPAVEAALQAVTHGAVQITGSYQATLRLLDESGRRLLLSARTGPPLHRRGSGRFVMGEGFIGWAAVHQQAAFANRVENDPRFVIRQGQSWMPSGILAAPLLTRSGCIGVLSASRRSGPPYTQLDLDLLALVAELSVPYLEIARLKRLNESDPLTLLHNRRFLNEHFQRLVDDGQRRGRALSAVMLDLDHFKQVNDLHGHRVGDEVLVEAADRLRQSCRLTDLPARWGGEEFLVLLPETRRREARLMAERIRALFSDEPFTTSAGPLVVTTSLGVAQLGPGDSPAALLQRADQALYRAKGAGRNCVRCG